MERKIWSRYQTNFGHFVCPRCRRGKLRIKDEILRREPNHVGRELHEEGLRGEMSAGRFAGLLTCNDKWCGEVVAVAGDYRTDFDTHQDGETGEEVEYASHSYVPFLMRPAPAIIEYPKSLANEIKPHMQRAFELFWSDHGSCANRLRIIVEMVLDQLGVPRRGPKGKYKDAVWNLSDRITDLDNKRPGHNDVLNALRHVGNTGSHEGDVDREDLIDCFELLEYALIELLEERRERLAMIAKRLIQDKGKNNP